MMVGRLVLNSSVFFVIQRIFFLLVQYKKMEVASRLAAASESITTHVLDFLVCIVRSFLTPSLFMSTALFNTFYVVS